VASEPAHMDILELRLDDAPAAFAVAMCEDPDGSVRLLGAGRGLTAEQARASCLGEAAERAAASRDEAVPIVRTHRRDLPAGSLAANQFWQLSARQIRFGPHPSEAIGPEDWADARRVMAQCREWCAAREARNGAEVFVPAACVRLGPALTGSNGLAAAATEAAAHRTALLELVERDAVAIWWYGRARRPAMPLPAIDDEGGAELRHWLEKRGRRSWVLDLTHDLGVPVGVGVSMEADGSGLAYGCASQSSPARAALAALLEMLQSELSLSLAARRAERTGQPEGPAGRFLTWSRAARIEAYSHILPDADARPVPGANGDPVSIIAQRTAQPILFVDLSGPDDALKVVRALVPSLRPWRPRFRHGRLHTVPGRLGWRASSVREESVADDVFLI
jgi:thiazole/oxazole-forming peptide maturase SagD family component